MQILADIMKMQINNGRMEVEHNGRTVSFVFSTFKKENFNDSNEVFKHINAFWLSQTPIFQQSVFDIYVEIEECFDDILNKEVLTERLQDAVKRLYDLHPFHQMKLWVTNYSGITIPPNFNELYIEDRDKNTTVDKTYIRDEYRELLTLSMMLRLMVPIWATYVRHIRSHTGNGLKELQAFKLLERTEIPDSHAIQKLISYIQANLRKENAGAPVNFISEDDFPYWIMSLICVRRLCVGDLQPVNAKANLVTLVHNFLDTKTSYTDGDFSNIVHSKTTDDFGGDENKISTMECFRINTEISLEESEELQVSMANMYSVVNKVCLGLPSELLERSLKTSKVLMDYPILPPQFTLMSWVMKEAISPSGIDFLEKETQVACLGLTEAVLWFKGFKYLALLATSVANMEDNVHRVAHMPTKSRVPEELQKELRVVFPHVRVIQNRKTPSREECPVTTSIELTTNDLASYSWRGTADPSMIHEVFGSALSQKVQILPEIRIELTKLAIAVGSNKLFEQVL